MNKRLLTIFAAASAISLGAAACSNKPDGAVSGDGAMSGGASDMAVPDDMASPGGMGDASHSTAMGANSHGSQFLTDGMMGDNAEVKMGELAAKQGNSAAVRSFGTMLAADHGKHLGDLATLAATMGVSKTTALMPEADAAYAKLKGLTGAAFDKAFAMHMVMDHKKDIAKYQAEVDSQDPKPLIDLARQTLPVLKKHLAAAQALPS